MRMKTVVALLKILALLTVTSFAQTSHYRYIRLGNGKDAMSEATFALALMGGGNDLDEAFRWLCDHGNGGDFLILRASGDDDYNPYVKSLCNANSVATLIMPSRESAEDAAVGDIIRKAEVVFISGGDQANYTRNWEGTPVEDALNKNIVEGKPIGGTSAGLAVLGEYVYSAEGDKPDDPDLTSAQVLDDPYSPRVALRRNFVEISLLKNTLTDTHFAKRDRLGRSLGFLARIVSDGWSANPREIAVDERNAVLVEATGKARVVGSGKGAYFISPQKAPEVCRAGAALSLREITIYRARSGSQFDLKQWRGAGGVAYSVAVAEGKLQSTQRDGQLY
jgi:cyanophycinase